ncbi:histidinol dehydrogenase [Alicyclobacillus cycloheptanicus]|uniref:histidinol dehydrogenase n=1 Tax=Alicyclobacillus cycloheptanicus TaxID=1457 RepID=UPI003898EB26
MRTFPAKTFAWSRTSSQDEEAMRTVTGIVSDVHVEGDSAVRRATVEFDGVESAADAEWSLRVDTDTLAQAWASLPADLQGALQRAAERICTFHAAQLPRDIQQTDADGAALGMVWRPLRRVGVYAPGGRAAYPSTVLMNVIPAQVAGVTEIALVSPPSGETGLPHPLVLAAAHLLGVKEVYRVGGAQAIAALAYGTETIARVDKVVGPGNLYVALAKRAVMGDVGIDSIAGPSEVFIVADATANPAYVAADMLAQAEHDPQAGAVLVTLDSALGEAVKAELSRQLAELPRRDVASQALARWGAIVVADNLDEAMQVVNESAPEHVELMLAETETALKSLRAAGAVFIGPYSPEPVGDYYAGPNHVLPTHGSARYASGLGVLDFVRRMTVVSYSAATLEAHAPDIVRLAEAEGLTAHARAVAMRLRGAQS